MHTESVAYLLNLCGKKRKNTKWIRQAVRMIFALSLIEKRRKRKYYVHPILKLRREEGEFLIKELRIYPERFKIYLRMSVGQFDALLAILEPHIKNKTTNFREPIDSERRLAVCLKWTRYGHTHGQTHTRARPVGSAGQTEQLGCYCVYCAQIIH